MTEKPILFSGEMVLAILRNTKSQTRRVIKCDGLDCEGPCGNTVTGDARFAGRDQAGNSVLLKCPHGETGGKLWVGETWQEDPVGEFGICYAATGHSDKCKIHSHLWRPSIFMPRRASRLTLEIVSVRAERLHDITEEDAKAEGAPEPTGKLGCYPAPWATCTPGPLSFRETFRTLWDNINAKRGFGWELNPWVWRIEFKRI